MRLNSIELVIKNLEIKVISLPGVGNMRSFQLLQVDDETMDVLGYCRQLVGVIDSSAGVLLRTHWGE